MWSDTLKNIASNFVEFKEEKTVSTPAPINGMAGIPGVSYAPAGVKETAVTSTVTQASHSPELLNTFTEKLKSKVLSAPTAEVYQHFTSMLESLKEFNPDEGQRIKAAVKLLVGQGVDYGSITASHRNILSDLGIEAAKFADALNTQRKTDVDGQESCVSDFTSKIAALEHQIQEYTTSRDKIISSIADAKNKLAVAESSFQAAVSGMRSTVEDGLRKLNTYIAPTVSTKA